MDTVDLFQRFSVALAIGLLIGLERGWQERQDEHDAAAGLRTHAVSGMLGATWGAIAMNAGASGFIALSIAFAAFTAVIATYRLREITQEGTFGSTTVVAAMAAFALGALAMLGDYQIAAAVGVAITALLSLKRVLQEWLRRLTWIELRSAIVLLAMTFILLPVLPNRRVDQLLGLNPYEIWLMTIMIAAISFAGYIAVRIAGEKRGILITGVAAGLVSSTAVTVTLARLAHDNPEHKHLATAGALAAGATMMARVAAVVAIFNHTLVIALLPPLVAAAVVTTAAAYVMVGRHRDRPETSGSVQLQNPFELGTVLKFGALLAGIMVLADFAKSTAGNSGLYGLAAVSGIADVDAITLTMSRQAGSEVVIQVAAAVIAIAVAVNTFSKSVIAWITGGRDIGVPMTIVALLAIAAGAATFMIFRIG